MKNIASIFLKKHASNPKFGLPTVKTLTAISHICGDAFVTYKSQKVYGRKEKRKKKVIKIKEKNIIYQIVQLYIYIFSINCNLGNNH
jgi:hypothetical protein